MKGLRVVYIFFLCCLFFYSVFKSFMKMQSEPTTFEETIIKNHATLPDITFCVDTKEDNFTTFQDIMDGIEREKTNQQNAWITFHGRTVEFEKIDLKNSSLLEKKFNVSFKDIWSIVATVSTSLKANILICSSLDLTFIELPEEGGMILDFKICSDKNFGVRFERHEPHQSFYNYQFDKNNGFQYFRKEITQYNLVIPVETEALKQTTHDCYEDNSMRKTPCIDEYIAEQLNCSLPWTKPHPDFGVCSGTEELTNFRTVHSKITSKTSLDKLKEKGCLKPNCLQTKWKDSYVSWGQVYPNCTRIRIALQSDSYTIRRKEILLADFSTFVVDCGSYLGLFLGASILSLTDTVLAYILKAGATFFRKINS